ncbi:hypothetical protein U1839_18825 [Sphingomonas sp. RT2P30]|uniref:hypothetical protein n=1 Tax=Parasphingomonas halimpatiens TaxID=3096162 RepID=UPI002FCC886D
MRSVALASLLMIVASPAAAQRTIPSADLATVSARGQAIYDYDQAAWHTTDAMTEKHLPDAALRAIRGWVVEPQGDALRVSYFGLTDGRPYTIYLADYVHGAVSNERVPAADSDRALSPLALRLAAARVAAVAAGETLLKCNDRAFNTVVLPPGPDGIIPVYLLSAQLVNDQYPMGGHHEIDIAADGRIVAQRDFTRSCLTVGDAAAPAGGKPVSIFVTHLLDPHPTEIHVFTSLTAHQPIFVGTPDGALWTVAGARIDREDPPKPARR